MWGVLGAIAASTDASSRAPASPVRSGAHPPRRRRPRCRHHVAAASRDGSSSASAPARRSTSTSSVTAGRRRRSDATMLDEAVEVIAPLWTGDTVDHRGAYYEVENARLFDPPDEPVPLIVSGFGAGGRACRPIGDGFWGNGTDRRTIDTYQSGGRIGPRYAQLDVCAGPGRGRVPPHVHEIWPNAAIPGQLSQDLPTWTHFEQATELVTEEHIRSVPLRPRSSTRSCDVAGVRRRRLRPPLLPPDRPRPGRLLRPVEGGAGRRAQSTLSNHRSAHEPPVVRRVQGGPRDLLGRSDERGEQPLHQPGATHPAWLVAESTSSSSSTTTYC